MRRILNLSQADIAGIVGKASSSIGNWEAGRSEPTLSELLKLTHQLKINMDDIVKKDLTQFSKKEILELQKVTSEKILDTNLINKIKYDLSEIQEMLHKFG